MGVKVLSPAALKEINCILKHIDRGCFPRILPGRGTNRNERLHRELNRVVHNTRLGVELAYALITCTFYKHNERIRAAREDRLAKPITAKMQCRKFNDGEKFGLATTPICKSAKQPAAAHNEQKLKLGNFTHASLSTRMTSTLTTTEALDMGEMDDDEVISKMEGITLLRQAILEFYISQHLLQVSTTVDPCSIFFEGFLSVIEHCMEHNIPESSPNEVVDTVLSQWNFRRIPVEGDGNCLFTAISLNILDRIMNNDQSLIGAFERFDLMPSITCRNHWMWHPYQSCYDVL